MPSTANKLHNLWFVCFVGVMYIVCSAGMIAFNKYLIHEGRFPFAVPLVMLHMAFCTCFTACLYFIKPSLFPSLTDPTLKVSVTPRLFFTRAVPIGVLFSSQLVLCNTAYLHSTVAFLQMLKEANLVLVYTLSLAVALERFNWRSARILVCVLVATSLTIHGEVNFSKRGFAMQGLSQVFESCKIVISAMLLSNSGHKLDALTYVLLVMPVCFVMMGIFLMVLLFVYPNSVFTTPQMSDLVAWWPMLLLNAMLAFLLNLVIALFVKHSSAVAFTLAGVCKDAMIVLVGGCFLGEVVTGMQAFGFTIQLVAITVYSLAKTFPDKFERGVFVGMAEVLAITAPTAPLLKEPANPNKEYGATDTEAGEKFYEAEESAI